VRRFHLKPPGSVQMYFPSLLSNRLIKWPLLVLYLSSLSPGIPISTTIFPSFEAWISEFEGDFEPFEGENSFLWIHELLFSNGILPFEN
jgi:hypothetical protein